MFVRCKTDGDRVRVQVVKSIRNGDKVHQRVLRHIGTATDQARVEDLKRVARVVIKEMKQADPAQGDLFSPREHGDLPAKQRAARTARQPKPASLGIDLADCRLKASTSLGLRDAMGMMYALLGWDKVLGARRASANRILWELVAARLEQPLTKRDTMRTLEHDGDVRLNLEKVERTLDHLDDAVVETLWEDSRVLAEQLLGGPMDDVFCHMTTLRFVSEEYCRPQRTRVVFALLVTADGLPCGYRLFPDAACGGHTLIDALDSLSKSHPAARFTVVAGAGMFDAENRRQLEQRGITYVLDVRLENETAAMQERILDPDGFETWSAADDDVAISRWKVIDDSDRRLVVTFESRRAARDARKRAKAVETLRRRLAADGRPAALDDRGRASFLKFPEGRVEIDEDEIAAAARWDGLGGIVAWGLGNADPRQLILRHRRLPEVEIHFRANGHDLRVRPVFDWGPDDIRAHIAICYMAYCCLQHVRYRLAVRGTPMSADAIRHELEALRVSVVAVPKTGKRYAVPSAASPAAERIYGAIGLRWIDGPLELRDGEMPSSRIAT